MFTRQVAATDRAVGVQLQNLRLFRNMTRQAAAERLTIKVADLADIEEGTARPAPNLLMQIVRLYDVAPSRAFAVAGRTPDVDSSL